MFHKEYTEPYQAVKKKFRPPWIGGKNSVCLLVLMNGCEDIVETGRVMHLYIAAGVGLAVLVTFAFLAARRLADERRLRAIWKSLEGDGRGAAFHPDMVTGLPEPARRYLLHAIKPGTPLASSVALRMKGKLRPKATVPWTEMKAREIICVTKGFLWKAKVRRGLSRVSGADHYADGQGRVRFWLWGVFPAVRMEGEDTTKSAIGRLAIEAVWLPSALLPQAGATWEAVDNHSAKVTIQIDGQPTTLVVNVEPDGKLRRSIISRWGGVGESGEAVWMPFEVESHEEREFGGYTIPSFCTAGWWMRSDHFFEFFRANVESAEFR